MYFTGFETVMIGGDYGKCLGTSYAARLGRLRHSGRRTEPKAPATSIQDLEYMARPYYGVGLLLLLHAHTHCTPWKHPTALASVHERLITGLHMKSAIHSSTLLLDESNIYFEQS